MWKDNDIPSSVHFKHRRFSYLHNPLIACFLANLFAFLPCSDNSVLSLFCHRGFAGVSAVKNPPANAGGARDTGLIPGLRRSSGGGNAIHFSILAWEIHGQRSLVGYSPWGRKELDITEHTLTKLWVFLEQMVHLEIVQPE